MMREGVLIRGMGGLYTVRDNETGGEYVLRAKKKFRRLKMSPLAGDDILFTPGDKEEHGWIEDILPRRSLCLRPPAANVDFAVIVVAPVPTTDWLLVDKLMLFARRQGLRTAIVVNKCDLSDEIVPFTRDMYRGAQTEVIAVSGKTGEGIDALKKTLKGKRACLMGQSGVGKSTVMNALFHLSIGTGEISKKISRGKNTTRHTELYFIGDFAVFDTPGFSLLDSDEAIDPVLLQDGYPEMTPYLGQCKFAPCYHGKEPGCAVRRAVEAGEISKERYERYVELLGQYRETWRNRYD